MTVLKHPGRMIVFSVDQELLFSLPFSNLRDILLHIDQYAGMLQQVEGFRRHSYQLKPNNVQKHLKIEFIYKKSIYKNIRKKDILIIYDILKGWFSV